MRSRKSSANIYRVPDFNCSKSDRKQHGTRAGRPGGRASTPSTGGAARRRDWSVHTPHQWGDTVRSGGRGGRSTVQRLTSDPSRRGWSSAASQRYFVTIATEIENRWMCNLCFKCKIMNGKCSYRTMGWEMRPQPGMKLLLSFYKATQRTL